MNPASTILIVDDEAQLRRTMAAILQRAGYLVVTAESAAEAQQFLASNSCDLMLLDIKLSDMDGIALLALVRQQQPSLPVLMITGHATLETAILAVRRGARDYFLKPVDPKFLLKRIGEIIEEQQQPARRRQIVDQVQNLIRELGQLDGADPETVDLPKRSAHPDPTRYIERGSLSLDLHSHRVVFKGLDVSLPPSTFEVLVTLVRHAPNTVPYRTLMAEALGYELSSSEAREMTRWHIHELRKVIEPDQRNPQYIITVRDEGYRLVV